MKKIIVNDKMQSNYHYYLTDDIVKNFKDGFDP